MTPEMFEMLQKMLIELTLQVARLAEATDSINGQLQSLEERLNVIEEHTR